MLWHKCRTISHLAQGRQQKSTIDDREQYSYECVGHLLKEKSNSTLRNDRYTCYCSHAHSFTMLLTYLGFPPGSTREAVAAASVIACVTTLSLSLFLSINILLLPTHSIQKLYQWQNKMNLLWNVPSDLSVSATPRIGSIHQ